MGFLKSLFGSGSKNNNQQTANILDKNNLLDISYAFGVLATQVAGYDHADVAVTIAQNNTYITVYLDRDTCEYFGANNLNSQNDLLKLNVPKEIASFIVSLDATYDDSMCRLQVVVSNSHYRLPSISEFKQSIISSLDTAKLPVKYNVSIDDGRIIVFIKESY